MAWCNLYDCDIEEVEEKKGKDFIYKNCGKDYYDYNCYRCENNSENIKIKCSRCGAPIIVNDADYDEHSLERHLCFDCFTDMELMFNNDFYEED